MIFLMGIGSLILTGFLVTFDKSKPLSKQLFVKYSIVIFIACMSFSYGFQQVKLEHDYDYSNYKEVNTYIHTLDDKHRKAFQKALISQKSNIELKYGFENSTKKLDSIDVILEKNKERYGISANPLKVEEYFNDDAYFISDNICFIAIIIYIIGMYYVYRCKVIIKK